MTTLRRVAVVVAAPLALAAVGLVHPLSLTTSTAEMWAQMHVLLLPVFPLLALGFVVPLYRMGDALGEFGVHAFLVAVVATCLALYPRAGVRILPGGLVLLVAGWSFVDSHIFRPRGVLTMLAIALGFALLTAANAAGRRAGP